MKGRDNQSKSEMSTNLRFLVFICACMAGMLLALILHRYQSSNYNMNVIYLTQPLPENIDVHYLKWLENQYLKKVPVFNKEKLYYNNSHEYKIESSFLYEKIKIICLIITRNKKRALAINSTWGQNCNDHIFIPYFSDNIHGSLKSIKPKSRSSFQVLCMSFHEITRLYHSKYNWVLIVEDKSFAIIENLRYFVAPYDSNNIHYFGHTLKDDKTKVLYNSANGGIVVSNGALKFFHDNLTSCATNKFNQLYDIGLGEVFNATNVHPIDTRDHHGRCRFNSFNMETLLTPNSVGAQSSYFQQSVYLSKEGLECCSDTAITFNNIVQKKMFFTYYLIYKHHILKQGTGIGNLKNSSSVATITNNTNEKVVNLINEDDDGAKIIKRGFAELIKSQKLTKKKSI